MPLRLGQGGLFFHATFRAAEQIQIETYPRPDGVEVGRAEPVRASGMLAAALRTEVDLRAQRTTDRGHGLVRLCDRRIGGFEAEVAVDRLVHYLVELR